MIVDQLSMVEPHLAAITLHCENRFLSSPKNRFKKIHTNI